ncbi:alpha/beta hydrolase (plasmid) [Azospirillum humicireducens]|uniref:Alpha/beta hydrolase n=1 Tax=Azospirillum humicireducens TaxID=1226968 RepID=A0A2R4VPU3_9PROT|nr:alpha/beta hydrolase [Azospirillum humicireducens]AWB06458.1 alpha/beta hydrolase [Azospirillum humicireducens]
MSTPHYVTIGQGQLRVWRSGYGPDLLVLPGLIAAASTRADQLARDLPGWTVTAVDLPGIGRSSGAWAEDIAGLARIIADGASALGLPPCPLLVFDLAAPLATALQDSRTGWQPEAVLLADAAAAEGWAARHLAPAPLAPRDDGTHLAVLWAHLRDAHVLEPRDARHPAVRGAPLPDPAAQDAMLCTASAAPHRYEALWSLCLDAMPSLADPAGIVRVETLDAAAKTLSAMISKQPDAGPLPPTQPFADPLRVWHDYANTPRGRVHLRRAGRGRPLLALQSAPGSSAPLLPLLHGLAPGWEVIAPDYLGNGESDKPDRAVDIGTLAEDVLAVADALGLDRFDLWGTHTGALVALELTVRHPERVGRAVLEAPVLIPPDFSADILTNYFPPLVADRWGLHLLQAWNMRRDMFMFWPWYRQERAAARAIGIPDAAVLHDWTMGLLASGAHYDRSYRAAFHYDTRARLPRLTRPALICAGPADMLVEGLAEAERLAPAGTEVASTPATVWYPGQEASAVEATIARYAAFLRGDSAADSHRVA